MGKFKMGLGYKTIALSLIYMILKTSYFRLSLLKQGQVLIDAQVDEAKYRA